MKYLLLALLLSTNAQAYCPQPRADDPQSSYDYMACQQEERLERDRENKRQMIEEQQRRHRETLRQIEESGRNQQLLF